MSAVESVLRVTPVALPAPVIARRAGVEIEEAYAQLVALEGKGAAKVEPRCGEWLWRLLPGVL